MVASHHLLVDGGFNLTTCYGSVRWSTNVNHPTPSSHNMTLLLEANVSRIHPRSGPFKILQVSSSRNQDSPTFNEQDRAAQNTLSGEVRSELTVEGQDNKNETMNRTVSNWPNSEGTGNFQTGFLKLCDL